MGCIFPRLFGVPKVERIRLLLYWPHTSALVALALAMALSRLFFLSLILYPVLALGCASVAINHLCHENCKSCTKKSSSSVFFFAVNACKFFFCGKSCEL